ncbi:MAG: hypothetical protein JWO89_1026 [Verrucomicrobiaceae bacterium]|nr:hypothetical protein [Verrucomicrobiaceae bacterium]
MNSSISSLLRIVCGLGLLVLTWSTYQKVNHPVHPGEQIQVLGMNVASAGQLSIPLVVFGLVGVGLLVLGIMGLMKSRD